MQEKGESTTKNIGKTDFMKIYMYIIPYGGVLVFGFEIEQKSLTISKKK